jgi:plastocyanin
MKISKLALAAVVAVAAGPAFAGNVKGNIKFAGQSTSGKTIAATKDQGTCGNAVPDESVLADGGKLKNVVVAVKGVAGAKAEPGKISLDQEKCVYKPHVQAAVQGSTIEIINSDPVLHNVHGYAGTQTTFNLAMPLKGQKIPKKLDKVGANKVKCDVHGWMNAYVYVHDSKFFDVAEDGTFEIKDVPAGSYTVTAWHETLGEKTAQVTVPESGDVSADFSY